MNTSKHHLLICCLLIIAASFEVKSTEINLLGSLKTGPHTVGFMSQHHWDGSRPPIKEQINKSGRGIQVNIWYPAQSDGHPMELLDYIKLVSKESNPMKTHSSIKDWVSELSQEQMNSHGISLNESGLIQLLQQDIPMLAHRGASPKPGPFPVIIIGPETAFKWAITAEFIASHGFVVATVPITGTDTKRPNHEQTLFDVQAVIKGLQTEIKDLQFLINVIRNLSHADINQTGLLGYSSNVTAGLGLALNGFEFKAVVSLEGGIGGLGGELLSLLPEYSLHRQSIPVVHFFNPAAPHDLQWLEGMRYAERLIIATYDIRHEQLTSYGALAEYVKDLSGTEKKQPRLAYEVATNYALNYFNAHLKNASPAMNYIQGALSEIGVSEIFQEGVNSEWIGIKRMKAYKLVSFEELEKVYSKSNYEGIQQLLDQLLLKDQAPFSKQTFYNFGQLIKKNNNKIHWYKHYVGAYPEFSEAHYLLATAAQKEQLFAMAKKHYQKALALFDQTDHVVLEEIFTRIIKNRLSKIKSIESN